MHNITIGGSHTGPTLTIEIVVAVWQERTNHFNTNEVHKTCLPFSKQSQISFWSSELTIKYNLAWLKRCQGLILLVRTKCVPLHFYKMQPTSQPQHSFDLQSAIMYTAELCINMQSNATMHLVKKSGGGLQHANWGSATALLESTHLSPPGHGPTWIIASYTHCLDFRTNKRWTWQTVYVLCNIFQYKPPLNVPETWGGGKHLDINASKDISDQSKFIHEQSVTPELSLWASSFPYRGNEGRKALHAISKLMANGFCYCGASRWPTDAFSVNEFPTDRIVFMYRATHSCLVLQLLMWTEFFYEFVLNLWPWNWRVFKFNCKWTN